MARTSEMEREDDGSAVIAPEWPQYLLALAGVALLGGPTLVVLWPR